MSYPRRNAATQRFSLGAPRTLIVTRDGEYVVFARSTAGDDPINRLWAIDVAAKTTRLLVDPVELLGGNDVELTAAEKARRERAREAGSGIVTYSIHSTYLAAIFVLGGRLFRTAIDTGDSVELETDGGAFDPRISPNGELVAYHASGSLRVTGDDEGDRLVIGPAESEQAAGQVVWGAAEFAAAEEMGRSRGFWWGPDSDRLLVARVDNTDVSTWYVSEPVDASITPRPMPYPAAGTNNAVVDLFIVGLDGSQLAIDWRQDEFEYLARAEWTKAHGITLTVQTRDQRTLALLTVDPETGEISELHRHTDPAWVELVIGAPRRQGSHLLTVRDDLETDTRRLYVDDAPVTPVGLNVRSLHSVDATHAIVAATTEPTELHVWKIALDGSSAEPLTTEPGIHRHVGNAKTWVITSSTMSDTRAVSTVHRASDEASFEIESVTERPELSFDVTFHNVTSRELRTALVLPADYDADQGPLPVLLDPYGGPHALRVQRARSSFAASQWFADQGYAVVVADGAGTPARGPEFERRILHDFATEVLDDQVAALTAVAEQHPDLLDTSRVGIRGWSFGGYLAALAVLKRPDVFHAGIAGAPVTDWLLYDTHYTERYLGHPADYPQAYESTDLTTMADQLERPLMLIHGLADDNVVAAHTFQLSRALLEAGRPHQVLPLSGVSHMTPQEAVAENLLKLQVAFLQQSLG